MIRKLREQIDKITEYIQQTLYSSIKNTIFVICLKFDTLYSCLSILTKEPRNNKVDYRMKPKNLIKIRQKLQPGLN